MSKENMFVTQVVFPKNVWNAIKWYGSKIGYGPNDFIIWAVEAQFDSEICSNCERIGSQYTEELKRILGWERITDEDVEEVIKIIPTKIS